MPKPRPRTGLVVSWQVLAVVLVLVTVASLTSLSIVATIKNVDALSTVALALAVLAFGAQLVDSVVQGQASTQQMLQSERLNAETRSLLSEVRVTSQEIRATQSGLVDRLMGHVLQAIPEAVEEVAATQADGDLRRLARRWSRTCRSGCRRRSAGPSPRRCRTVSQAASPPTTSGPSSC
jgi:hypothetical protein